MFSNLLQLLRRRRCGGKCRRNTKGDAAGDCQEHPTVCGAQTASHRLNKRKKKTKAAGRGSVYVRRRATTSRVRRHLEKKKRWSRKEPIRGRAPVRRQSRSLVRGRAVLGLQ